LKSIVLFYHAGRLQGAISKLPFTEFIQGFRFSIKRVNEKTSRRCV